ncbi:hypothetical protein PFISCL1PPCAC_21677, partial [Pristionchus fissidentatus]
MGNSASREDRALSPLSAWGDRFDEIANGKYEDIVTPHTQRVGRIDRVRSALSAKRKDSLEHARLGDERRTRSADSVKEISKRKKKKKRKGVNDNEPLPKDPLTYPPGDILSTHQLDPYPHDPPVETTNEQGLDAAVPGILPRRKKEGAPVVMKPELHQKSWSAPTLPPEVEIIDRNEGVEPTEPVASPPYVPVVQPRRTDGVRVGKPVHPPVNPARFITL